MAKAKATKGKMAEVRETDRATMNWKCGECHEDNPAVEPKCLHCRTGTRWDLITVERAIVLCVTMTTAAAETWRSLRTSGATDAVILTEVAAALGNKDDHAFTTDGPACWTIHNGVVAFWGDEQVPPAGRPPLSQDRLVEIVRDVFRIPKLEKKPRKTVKAEGAWFCTACAMAKGWNEATDTECQNCGRPRPPKDPDHGAIDLRDDEPASTADAGPDVRNIPVELIDRFPLNPRDELEFDEASLRELGGELKQRQVQACVVRPAKSGDRFELIAGERRYRAAKLCKLPTLRCEVVKVDTATAVWMCGQENERRKDWSAIAKARWYRELKRAESLTDEQLAKRVGVSQGQVTSTMGLLDLPDDWQRRVISQEISATAVRGLIPWAKARPQVLEQVATELRLPGSNAKAPRTTDEAITVREMEDAILTSLEKCTRCMNPDGYVRDKPLFSISKKVRESLDVEKLKIHRWSSGTESRAWNVEEWERLQKEAKKRKKASGEGTAGGNGHAAPVREQFCDWRLREAVEEWQAGVVLKHLPNAPAPLQLRFTLLCLSNQAWEICDRFADGNRQGAAFWEALRDTKDDAIVGELFQCITKLMADDGANEVALSQDEWTGIGDAAGVKWADEFAPSREMLEAWPLADLKKFPNFPKDAEDKEGAIAGLLDKWKKGFIPKQVRKLLGLKAGRGDV